MQQFIITGTDTNAGKTLASACLMLAMGGSYWKPMQSGQDTLSGLTDREWVKQITNLPDENFFPETYQFKNPLSPHRAAELEQTEIDTDRILSDYQKYSAAQHSTLLIEGAGGLMVPVTRSLLQIDLFVQMQKIAPAPVILVARTGLGTINHTLLSIAAIRDRNLPLHGILFSGPDNPDNIKTIAEFSGANIIGHIPDMGIPDTRQLMEWAANNR